MSELRLWTGYCEHVCSIGATALEVQFDPTMQVMSDIELRLASASDSFSVGLSDTAAMAQHLVRPAEDNPRSEQVG